MENDFSTLLALCKEDIFTRLENKNEEIFSRLDDNSKYFHELKTSIEHFSNIIVDFNKTIKESEQNQSGLKQEVARVAEENMRLVKRVEELELSSHQYSCISKINVLGVPIEETSVLLSQGAPYHKKSIKATNRIPLRNKRKRNLITAQYKSSNDMSESGALSPEAVASAGDPAASPAPSPAPSTAPATPEPGATPSAPTPAFSDKFKAFSKFGDSKSDGRHITLSQSDKWMKQAKVIDGKKITTTDTGIYFKKFKSQKIGSEDYNKFLEDLAKNKKIELEVIKKKMADCGPPGLTASSSAAKAPSAVERLTDTTKYTGSHKQRFDETGKGKGIAGRKDLPDGSGYVQGYQNKDSYNKTH